MYETSNTGTGNEMRGTRRIGGMTSKIPGNVAKQSRDCFQTSRGMAPNIPGNAVKHSGECTRKTYRIFENNLGQVVKHSMESMKAFR